MYIHEYAEHAHKINVNVFSFKKRNVSGWSCTLIHLITHWFSLVLTLFKVLLPGFRVHFWAVHTVQAQGIHTPASTDQGTHGPRLQGQFDCQTFSLTVHTTLEAGRLFGNDKMQNYRISFL